MKCDYEQMGFLALIKVDPRVRRNFLQYHSRKNKESTMDILSECLGDYLFKFLDTFSGETITIPNRVEVLRTLTNTRIYNFIESRGGPTPENVSKAMRYFKRRRDTIESVYQRTKEILEMQRDDV